MDTEEIEEKIDDLKANTDQLSNWELSFLADITDVFDRTGFLSQGQQDKLEEIHSKL